MHHRSWHLVLSRLFPEERLHFSQYALVLRKRGAVMCWRRHGGRATFVWKTGDLLAHKLEAVRHAFLPEETKARPLGALIEGWGGGD